jgi:hypothetical protein
VHLSWAGLRTRSLSGSKLARLYICRLISLSRIRDSGSGSFISLPLLDRESISSTAPRPLMHADCRTMLCPYVKVQSAETLHRLLAYLGATPAQLAAFDEQRNRWGQGTAHVTLAPGRKNLLRLRRWIQKKYGEFPHHSNFKTESRRDGANGREGQSDSKCRIRIKDPPRSSQMTEAEIRENATQFLKNADHGIQTAVCGSDGATLRSVIGLNGSVIILTQLRTRLMK